MTEKDLINTARLRVNPFPVNWIKLRYAEDVDSLFLQISNEKIAISKADYENGVIFNFNKNGEIVSFEILDLYEIFSEDL